VSCNDVVRIWKDPDAPGDATHPAGEIELGALSGGAAAYTLVPTGCQTWEACQTWQAPCPETFAAPRCVPTPVPR